MSLHVQLEYKLRDAVRDNAAASREVKTLRASLKALQLGKLRQPARHGKQRSAAVSGPNPPCLLPSPSLCSGLSPDCPLVMAGLFQ